MRGQKQHDTLVARCPNRLAARHPMRAPVNVRVLAGTEAQRFANEVRRRLQRGEVRRRATALPS